MPTEVASENQEEIRQYSATLAAILPDWLTPNKLAAAAAVIRDEWTSLRVENEDFLLLEQIPPTFPRWDNKWKLISMPKPGRGNLDAYSSSEVDEETSQNSTSKSGE